MVGRGDSEGEAQEPPWRLSGGEQCDGTERPGRAAPESGPKPVSEAQETFLSVVEVWRPDGSGDKLRWAAGHYDAAPEFGAVSRDTTFAMGEGVPGQVWETGRPVLLDGLVGTNFVRVAAAADAGLGSVLAIPYRRRGRIQAVVVFLMNVRRDLCGVAEVWTPDRDGGPQLELHRGYYSGLTHFGAASQQVRFARGEGLPGRVWQTGRPLVAPDVASWDAFVRRSPAEADHIKTGIGIPLFVDGGLESVVTMFGTREVPLARDVSVVLTSQGDSRAVRVPAVPTIARRWRRPVLRLPVHGPRDLAGLVTITL